MAREDEDMRQVRRVGNLKPTSLAQPSVGRSEAMLLAVRRCSGDEEKGTEVKVESRRVQVEEMGQMKPSVPSHVPMSFKSVK